MHITSLHRYAVKGLSGDSIDSVTFQEDDGTFEDDRRFALLYDDRTEYFNKDNPEWLHKDNFLCAFTAPELLATLRTEYKVDPNDGRRLLTVWTRNEDETDNNSNNRLIWHHLVVEMQHLHSSQICVEKRWYASAQVLLTKATITTSHHIDISLEIRPRE